MMESSGLFCNISSLGVVDRDSSKNLDSLKRGHSDTEIDEETKIRKHSSLDDCEFVAPVPLFLVISNKEEGKNLSKVSPFLINKALVGAGGQPKSVKKLQNGTILVEATNERQSYKFLKMSSFFDQVKVDVAAHNTLNSSRGIVFSRELLECSLDELKQELKNEHVTDVVRITRRENGEQKPTPGHILTFSLPHPPEKIKAGYLSLSVRPFYRNPQRCFKCQKFGHSSKVCPNSQTCCRCGQIGHVDDDCTNEEHCLNCKGKHYASSRDCKVYLEEKEILKIATSEKLSFFEARKEYRRRQILPPRGDTSYAKAASSQAVQSHKCTSCSMLEGVVRSLTEQVAALVKQLGAGASKVGESSPMPTTSHSNPQARKTSSQLKPNVTPLSQSQRKVLQDKIRANIATKVADRSKGGGKTPSRQSSHSSSLEEDMCEDPRSQAEFNTLKGKFTTVTTKNRAKVKYP